MIDRSGRDGAGGEVCSATAGDHNRDGTGVVSRWTRSLDISGLFTISCFTFTTAGDNIHRTNAWGRGKVLQVLLFPYSEYRLN